MSGEKFVKLLKYCKWAAEKNEKDKNAQDTDYAAGLAAGMSMAFNTMAGFLQGEPVPNVTEEFTWPPINLNELIRECLYEGEDIIIDLSEFENFPEKDQKMVEK